MVVYVPLRHAKHGVSSVVDLVCDSVSDCDLRVQKNMKQILGDSSIPCLVILDGLDEWRAPDTCRVRGFPDSSGLVNCTLLCTMRPWRMINLLLELDSKYDKVVQILGLKRSSVKTVIKNVLLYFYGFDVNSNLYKQKYKQFCKKSKLPGMKSLLKVPLMLTSSCIVWNEESDVSSEKVKHHFKLDEFCSDSDDSISSGSDDSSSSKYDNVLVRAILHGVLYFMTFFYLKLMEITITRAKLKHDLVRSFLCPSQRPTITLQNTPHILSGFSHISDFLEVIKPIGRLALRDLVSDQTYLVFPRDKLERDIGHPKVELALKAGILSQTKAPGLSYQQRITVSFSHKSIQEFIAALYMTCGDTEALTSFRTHCNTVDKVMELSNMMMFVFGLDPVVGCQLSEHVKNVVNSDADIIQYRGHVDRSRKVDDLYAIQCNWSREMKHNLTYTYNTDRTPALHVTDLYLQHSENIYYYVSADDVSVASELVSMENNSIVSVYIYKVKHPINSILQYLPGCKHLTTIYITYDIDTQSKDILAKVLPQLVQLQYIRYLLLDYDRDERCPLPDTAVILALQRLPALRYLNIGGINLTDTVTLPPQLQTVKLWCVEPANFILPSVCQCRYLTCIKLAGMTLTDTTTLPQHLQKVTLEDVRPAHLILPSLLGCPNLTSLHIEYFYFTMDECQMLASVLPQLPRLQCIHYNGQGLSHCGPAGHSAVVSALQHLTQLRHIELLHIDLDDDGTLLVTPHMTQLQEVELINVKMSDRRLSDFVSSLQFATQLTHIKLGRIDLGGAGTLLVTPHMTQLQKVELREAEFVSSLLSVQHTVHVSLTWTDIDKDTVKTIHSSTHFTVTMEDRYKTRWKINEMEFHTVQ